MINIALVGFMGSGKTTVGRILSERLRYSFIDIDTFIEEKTCMAIPDIFKSDGEERFRQIESAALEEVLSGEGTVVSCGGGVVLKDRNRAMLKQRALVVYLKADAEEVFARVGQTGHKRPLLNVENPEAEINRLLEEREPLYREVADIIIDTIGKSKDNVVDLIVTEIKSLE